MESIIGLIFLTLFVILIYNYSLYYFKYHKDIKKYYISYSNKKDRSDDGRGSDGRHKSDGGDRSDGGRGSDNDKERKSQIINNNCEKNQCKNKSTCIPTETGYECQCVSASGINPDGTPFSGRTFSGTFCEFENDKSLGVRVILDDEKMVPQIVYTRKPMFDTQSFQFNDFI